MTDRPVVPFNTKLQELRDLLPELLIILEQGKEDQWYAFVCIDEQVKRSVIVSTTEMLNYSVDRGIVMRIFAGAKNFEYASNNLESESLLQAAHALRQRVESSKLNNTAPVYTPLSWAQEDIDSLDPIVSNQLPKSTLDANTQVHFGTPYTEDPLACNLKIMANNSRKLQQQILDKDADNQMQLVSAGASISQSIQHKIFVDRCKNMSECRVISIRSIFGVSPKGLVAREASGGLGGFETATISDKQINYVATMPHKLDTAERLEAGRYKLLTGPDITGVIAHEAFGHTQEGDTRRLGRSCATALEHEQTAVGNEHASIINNAGVFAMDDLSWGSNGSHFFDDEGQLAREHVILDKGFIKSPMNDLISAVIGDDNGPSSRQSNGKRESWRRPIMARQTNTYFTAGDKSLEELIGMVDDGFMAAYAHGGMEDPKGMGLTAGADYLEEIKDGKLTGRIFLGPHGGHIELSDPVPKILKSIIAKSSSNGTPTVKLGGCGKYYKESVAAGCGGPWILWESLNCG